MTDRDREEVDANAKQMVRELNAGIRALDEAETLRRETEAAIIQKKYGSAFGALGSWASGGLVNSKTAEHVEAESKAQQTEIHRDSILWFLRQRLELCCRTQQDMMETRLTRELEKARGFAIPPSADFADFAAASRPKQTTRDDGGETAGAEANLTDEQMQMFEEGNQDMMKYYESTLDKVRYEAWPLKELQFAPNANNTTGQQRNRWSRYPNCSPFWSTIWQYSLHTLNSLYQTRSLRQKMWEVVIKN